MKLPIHLRVLPTIAALGLSVALPAADAKKPDAFRDHLLREVEALGKQAQVMNDMIFSFGELGFHEVETSKYLTGLLEKEGFEVERGIAGMPTAWMATWSHGTGKPVIALGSDIDGIPQASQKPGVSYHSPIVEGAPGHGEGHNSGSVLNFLAAKALKALLIRENISGTIKLWPGVAEEQLGAKAHLVSTGHLKDVDVCLFAHVDSNFSVNWGTGAGTGLVSVEYTFEGETAHAGGAPWRGRSALDAVELMNIGWNFRREHLRLQHRSHYVITNGGDQPNVVPRRASVWYYFRELDYDHISKLRAIGDSIAQGAALMTDTKVSSRILGTAWPQHMNKTVAGIAHEHITRVGLPTWSDADQTLAKAVQRELGVPMTGLAVTPKNLAGPASESNRIGGSDDIGDISWNMPTITLRYPSNIPNLPGHNWTSAIAMATPIAHKGIVAGAKVQALTMLDLFLRPELVDEAWKYFREVQTRDQKYTSFLQPDDRPAIWLNEKIMAEYRAKMRPYYYNPDKYDTYLEQLGIIYPTIRTGKK